MRLDEQLTETERELARWMLSTSAILPARDAIEVLRIEANTAEFILRKWAERNWYHYTLTFDMGELTEAGQAALYEAIAPRYPAQARQGTP